MFAGWVFLIFCVKLGEELEESLSIPSLREFLTKKNIPRYTTRKFMSAHHLRSDTAMSDTQLLGLHAFLWVKKFSHLRQRWLKAASTRAMFLSVWHLTRNTNMVVTLLLQEKSDNHTVSRGSYQKIYIACYLWRVVLGPVIFLLMDAAGEANWHIGTVWSPRINLIHCVIISAYQSNLYVFVHCICVVWLLCVVQVDASGRADPSSRGVLLLLCDQVRQ